MDCHQARRTISAYLDHELDAALARQLESHLNHCTDCRKALSDFQELDDLVQGLPVIDPGPDFAWQMVMKLREQPVFEQTERTSKLSPLARLSRMVEDFVELAVSAKMPSTGTLEEFSDFPPLGIGHAYFKLISVNR